MRARNTPLQAPLSAPVPSPCPKGIASFDRRALGAAQGLDDARALMYEWTQSEALRIHMESVASCMKAYAEKLAPEEVERWIVTGLLHDFDYEKHPTEAEHPFVGVEHLRSLGVHDDVLTAILGHAEYSDIQQRCKLQNALIRPIPPSRS